MNGTNTNNYAFHHPDSIVICAIYYVAWIYLLPWLRHYEIRSEILDVGGSAATHRLVKVPKEELASWDSTHDAAGRVVKVEDEKKGREGEGKLEVEDGFKV